MPVASMTGFARWESDADGLAFVWELRSVNGKGLDLRLRLPVGLESIEVELRRLAAARLSRGNVQASLQVQRAADAARFAVNQELLQQVLDLSGQLVRDGHATLPTADGLLALRGVIEVVDETSAPKAAQARDNLALQGFAVALERLADARADEGRALALVLHQRINEIESLVDRADKDEARTPAAIRERLARQMELLLQNGQSFDEQRLAQEAVLIAARVDIREEIDRLRAHIVSARALLAGNSAIGRRLDFLSQEFNRESNTICSKSNAASLTAIGLELKVVVDQFREQVQNIE